ncbi:ribonuclease P protein subunit p38 [Hippoglossus hippoglossus]|uniref:ribonuclease P protein subunit p38 n=1 Tax=Hippoglossus hippoglossus TaxID=8267 RepID=UPI00148DE963|nr:ribonuclease P protein subunit p38 [Hippoglossus hippoglossus]XP_034467981.1 ribonuclease P protein subunit p38 [Hippoglossus hippoglossus]XP_034467982.1 ribonuclease P protein subunit p38 [Hippoglossus hippoglossus]XP_034467983.1 ribonuclease P protein subunit p38 [Hippoglossus hippoglossus]
MATPKKLGKKETKRLPPGKTSLASPFTPTWSPLPQEDMQFILQTLKDKLFSMGLEKKEVKIFRPWRKKKKEQESAAAAAAAAAATPEPVAQVQDSSKNGWTDVAARRQLAIGINEVTKALERNELRLLLVCKSVKPNHMTSHLITLSATRGVPACQVPRLSQSVSEPLGLKSVLALGFRRCASRDEEIFTDIIDVIRPRVPSLNIAWLPGAAPPRAAPPGGAPAVTPDDPADMEEEAAGEKGGQKRKLESDSEAVTESPSSCTLQPLTVKRIVANPAKKKKKK